MSLTFTGGRLLNNFIKLISKKNDSLNIDYKNVQDNKSYDVLERKETTVLIYSGENKP